MGNFESDAFAVRNKNNDGIDSRRQELTGDDGEPKPPVAIARLFDKEWRAERGYGAALSLEDSSSLSAYRKISKEAKAKYPDSGDREFRDLYMQDQLAAEDLGPPLSTDQQVKLLSKSVFPNRADEQYRSLWARNLNAQMGNGEPLNTQEEIKLKSKSSFPDQNEEDYRALYERALLAGHGMAEGLTEEQEAKLAEGFGKHVRYK